MHPSPNLPFAVRYPIAVRVGGVLVVMGVVRLAIGLGWLPPEWELSESGVEQAFDALAFAWAWFSAQRKTTPVAAPRDDDGTPLVPARPHGVA
jgi:hypothetical protein